MGGRSPRHRHGDRVAEHVAEHIAVQADDLHVRTWDSGDEDAGQVEVAPASRWVP